MVDPIAFCSMVVFMCIIVALVCLMVMNKIKVPWWLFAFVVAYCAWGVYILYQMRSIAAVLARL